MIKILNGGDVIRDNLMGFLDHYNRLGADGRYCRFLYSTSPSSIRDWLLNMDLTNEKEHFIVFVENDAFLGVGQLSVKKNYGNISISVVPESQRKGIGSCIIDEIIELAKSLKLGQLGFECHNRNKASQNLFQNFGFKTVYDSDMGLVIGELIF